MEEDTTQARKRLLIVGGGAAGLLTAMKAGPAQDELGLEITLIDCKDFFEYTPALISVLYEKEDEQFEQHFRQVTTEYKSFLTKYGVKFVLGIVERIAHDRVILSQDGGEIRFDMAVICSGSSYHDPWKISCENGTITWLDRLHYLRSQRDQYKSSKSILCIGGGPVAVEVAAEIAYRAPSKDITLVNASDVVLEGTPGKMSHGAQNVLKNLNTLRLISGERAEPKGDNGKGSPVYVTDKTQTTVTGDLAYLCTGIKPNTWFCPDEWLDEKRQIQVDNCFRVEAVPGGHIFALGDANNIKEPNLFFTAHMQAVHFVKNLHRKCQTPVPYHGSQLSMVISLGPSYAVGSISGFSLTGWPLTTKKGSKIASLIKHIIERITMDDFHSKILVNDILYYMHENNHLPQRALRSLTLATSQKLAID